MIILRLFFILVISASLLGLAVFGVLNHKINTPLDSANTNSQAFIIENGLTLNAVSKQLQEEGLIGNALYFTLHAFVQGKSTSIQAGVYELTPSQSVKEILQKIGGGDVIGFDRITIPEGFTSKQIEQRLMEFGIDLQEGEFVKEVADRELEGRLFPDTYELSNEATIEEIIDKFLVNFESKTKDLALDSNSLILASLIEEEVRSEEDMKLVSGVLHNRLAIDMALQVDATLAYITGKGTGEITNQDKLIDSPFNTYKYRGLPSAPITNPGLLAIEAALNPTPSEYFYYLSAKEDGRTIFSKTLAEHNENRIKYLR